MPDNESALIPETCPLPERNLYFIGELVEAEVYDPGGMSLGNGQFTILGRSGSGFAGTVYQARLPRKTAIDFQVDPRPGAQPGLLALKVLRPINPWKTALRDLFFFLSFQSSYAPRLRAAAVRSGLIWQAILRRAASIDLADPEAVARPLGYYWDAGLRAYVEIHEWVESRAARYGSVEWQPQHTTDASMASSRPAPAQSSEMQRKRAFMRSIAWLCERTGALGLRRQYEWYTFVSQANVLLRSRDINGGPPDRASFTAIDFRVGLAVPFFLPLSPVHLAYIWRGLSSGRLVFFDEVDFGRLEAYAAAHADVFAPLAGWIEQLKRDDEEYRRALPDLWHTWSRARRGDRRGPAIQAAILSDCQRLGRLSPRGASRCQRQPLFFLLYLLCGCLPILGGELQRLLGDETHRTHLRRILGDPPYRRATLHARQQVDVRTWQETGRIGAGHAAVLAGSLSNYWVERLAFGWLPARLQRLATDPAARRRLVQAWVGEPLRRLWDAAARQAWLDEILINQQERGVLPPEHAARLARQAQGAQSQAFLLDLGFILALEIFSKAVYLLLAVYGILQGNYLPLAAAALGPVPPSGLARALYAFLRLVAGLADRQLRSDRRLLSARLVGLLVAPWRWVGNLFPLLEMFAYAPQLSLLVADDFVSRLVRAIPVLGGRGKLLEYWAFQLIYGLPLALAEKLAGKNKN